MFPFQVDPLPPTDPQPWWGESVIAGSFLVLGILISFFTTWLTNVLNSKKELARRFDEDIRQAGADFINKADAFWESEKAYYKIINKQTNTDLAAKERLDLIEIRRQENAQRNKSASDALQPLSFVAPDSLIKAARNHYVTILSTTFVEDFASHNSKYWQTRREVVDEVRQTLNLPSSTIDDPKSPEKSIRSSLKMGYGKFTKFLTGRIGKTVVIVLIIGAYYFISQVL